jgi:hypothetical protein
MQNWNQANVDIKYFDRLCFAAGERGKLQTTYRLFSDFAFKNVTLYNSLGTLSKQDGNATTTAIHTMIFLISYKKNE